MALFIPEQLGTAGAKSILIKRELSHLDDSYVVRTPFLRKNWLPDFFVQHNEQGWLAICVSDAPYASLSGDQLFADDQRAEFEILLKRFDAFSKGSGQQGEAPLKKLVLLWKCSTQETQQVSSIFSEKYGVALLSRDAFKAGGAQLVSRILSPISATHAEQLLSAYFPEAEIHPSSTTRRLFHRDNSATLGKYFLDYNQEWAAKLDLLALQEAPQEQTETSNDFSLRLINGVAGSGKTLIAISRALLLAEMHPNQQVLVLIHNTPVVAEVVEKLKRTRGTLPGNLKILTFFSWAATQYKNLFGHFAKCAYTDEVTPVIAQLRPQWPELVHSDDLLLEELDFINEAIITDQAAYLSANRAGRGFALREKERRALWALYEAVTATLMRMMPNKMLWSAMPHAICVAPDHSRMVAVDHVLIDEAQFFAPSWFQTVRLSLRPSGSLFLCADPNQGFMKSRLSWKSVGLEVAGRTKKLHKSYRTTQAILSAANQILQLHTKGDAEDYLQPDMAGMAPGTPPRLLHCESVQDTIEKLINEIEAARQSGAISLPDMLIVYGDNVASYALYNQISKHFGPEQIWWFNKQENKSKPPSAKGHNYLRMASVETATGLEAGMVFLLGMERLTSLRESTAAQRSVEEHEASQTVLLDEENARKLYMAMTRAGQSLVLLTAEPVNKSVARAFFYTDEESPVVAM